MNNLFLVKVIDTDVEQENDCVDTALDQEMSLPNPDIQSGSLLDFYLRFAHLSHGTFERMAGETVKRIGLMNRKRPTCVACPHGKQRCTTKSHMDTRLNATIDRVCDVICSDIKGPITSTDRLVNLYMINFIDHKSNYCRVFFPKTSSWSSFSSTSSSDLIGSSAAYAEMGE